MVDELERLARAASNPMLSYREAVLSKAKMHEAANPAAILELISINRELVSALKESIVFMEKMEESHRHPIMAAVNARSTLSRINGESNERF